MSAQETKPPRRRNGWIAVTAAALALGAAAAAAFSVFWPQPKPAPDPHARYLDITVADMPRALDALERLEADWRPSDLMPLMEVFYVQSSVLLRERAHQFINRQIGLPFEPQPYGISHHLLYEYAANERVPLPAGYASFKSKLYSRIDPTLGEYFAEGLPAEVSLGEVRWGGVKRDGIPPLGRPAMIPAAKASYLEDGNVVFGLAFGGEARAYPQRILGRHEMVKDVVAGKHITGVYCPLCGAMIAYLSEHKGRHHELGTSGFLYRSNKLMYDHATRSLWSTFAGRPVVGPLVGSGIALERLPVVTTTWGEWRRLHPDTTALSLDTGHERDYGEGQAYARYLSHDGLMFDVAVRDRRLANKAQVLAFRDGDDAPLAISCELLSRTPVFHEKVGPTDIVVLTDASGANRAYAAGKRRFTGYTGGSATDTDGVRWRVREDALVREGGTRLERVPAHRAFWFGWYAAFPKTRLVK